MTKPSIPSDPFGIDKLSVEEGSGLQVEEVRREPSGDGRAQQVRAEVQEDQEERKPPENQAGCG